MLTATYTLVALSVEQASMRLSLLAFQQYVRSTLMRQSRISLHQLEYACATLNQLYQACRWRKIEMYLIPAIRASTERADQLLDELGRLNQSVLGVIGMLTERIVDGDEALHEQVAQTCAGIEAACAALLQRLEKEEQELFAIARRVIGGEAWFAIAHQFMVHDARVEEERRTRPGAARTALSVWSGAEAQTALPPESRTGLRPESPPQSRSQPPSQPAFDAGRPGGAAPE